MTSNVTDTSVYSCNMCGYKLSESDNNWALTINTGKCPRCKTILDDFPPPKTKEEKEERELVSIQKDMRGGAFYIGVFISILFLIGIPTGSLLLILKHGSFFIRLSEHPVGFGILGSVYGIVSFITIQKIYRWIYLSMNKKD